MAKQLTIPPVISQEYEQVATNRLTIHPRNVRQGDLGVIIESIQANGWYGACVVQRSSRHVIAGNHRLLAARELQIPSVPVIWVDCSDEEALRMMLVDNASNDKASNNPAALAELLAELAGTDKGLLGLGYDGDDLDALISDLAGMPQSGLLADADPDAIPDDAPTRVKPGELWLLGNHRLLCGDSTKPEDVARLMGGGKADFVYCDPPYGMNLVTEYARSNRVFGNNYDRVIGDDVDFDPRFYFDYFKDSREQFWWGADYYCQHIPKGGAWVVWDKKKDDLDESIGTGFELCWSKLPHKRMLARFLWSGFTARERDAPRTHPTQKPVALAIWFFERWGKPDDNIVDLFLGSGTTLIAAEQLGRKCYGMELEPKYCDVILSRWEKATGKTAELIENGTT